MTEVYRCQNNNANNSQQWKLFLNTNERGKEDVWQDVEFLSSIMYDGYSEVFFFHSELTIAAYQEHRFQKGVTDKRLLKNGSDKA